MKMIRFSRSNTGVRTASHIVARCSVSRMLQIMYRPSVRLRKFPRCFCMSFLLKSSCSTVSTLYTTVYDEPSQTVTVPENTTVIRATVYDAPHVVRRQVYCRSDPDTSPNTTTTQAPNPVSSILSNSAGNASIAAKVYSACSCLQIAPGTVDDTSTVQTVCPHPPQTLFCFNSSSYRPER